jgi:hypothetical protein
MRSNPLFFRLNDRFSRERVNVNVNVPETKAPSFRERSRLRARVHVWRNIGFGPVPDRSTCPLESERFEEAGTIKVYRSTCQSILVVLLTLYIIAR